jgi:hypothetical protein
MRSGTVLLHDSKFEVDQKHLLVDVPHAMHFQQYLTSSCDMLPEFASGHVGLHV